MSFMAIRWCHHANLRCTLALPRSKINHVLTRHEQGATHAAEGWARVKGKAGVCFATSGPGATNLITGIADAIMDSTPMVCITDKFQNIY